jgi:hypothetical protein
MVPQSGPSEDGEVDECRPRPNTLDPVMTFGLGNQIDRFSPNDVMLLMIGELCHFPKSTAANCQSPLQRLALG